MSAATAPAPVLVVLGGLPGVGKSTVARALLVRWPAVYLRIDTIEQALRDSGTLIGGDVGAAGYLVAYALARTHLAQGMSVLADGVNPLPVTRKAWCAVAQTTGVPILEVELICSDVEEHRRRVETRVADVHGLSLPTWESVLQHDYARWDGNPLVVDTAGLDENQTAACVLAAVTHRRQAHRVD